MRITFLFSVCCLIYFTSCKNCPECPESSEIKDTVIIKDTVPIESDLIKEGVPFFQLDKQLMYFHCENILETQLPEGYTDLKINSSSPNTKVTALQNGQGYSVDPGDPNFILTFTANKPNGDKFEYAQRYEAVKPPLPTIELLVNGKPYTGMVPINKKSNCVIRLKPDKEFEQLYPKDAKYIITGVELLAQRSLGPASKVGSNYNGAGRDATRGLPISLANKLKSDSPGTTIYFKVNSIIRVNSKNQKIAIPMEPMDLILTAVIK